MTVTLTERHAVIDDYRLLIDLRRRTGLQFVHHRTGGTAPAWLVADLATLSPGELRQVHVWTGVRPYSPRHHITVHVRLHGRCLTVWQLDTARPLTAVAPSTVTVRSVRQAVDVLVALEILHPQWSSITRRLTGYGQDNADACRACAITAGFCPFHRGQDRGARLLLAAIRVLVRRPILTPGPFGRLVMRWLAREGVNTPDGPLLLKMIGHLPEDTDLLLQFAAIAATFPEDEGTLPC